MENKKRIVLIIIIGAFVVSDVFFGLNYYLMNQELQTLKTTENKIELNTKVLNFASMFIKKVLQANTEVDFETRLTLENAIRDLDDEEVMAEWQNFTSSKTERDAQNSVKKLLGLLISKIQK